MLYTFKHLGQKVEFNYATFSDAMRDASEMFELTQVGEWVATNPLDPTKYTWVPDGKRKD